MNINDNDSNGSRRFPIKLDESSQAVVSEVPLSPPDTDATNSEAKDEWVTTSTARFATRAGINGTEGIGKLILLGGGLAAAVLFFVFTALVGKAPKKQAGTQPTQQAKQEGTKQSKGSVTPVMETVRTPAQPTLVGSLVQTISGALDRQTVERSQEQTLDFPRRP
jgi:hypothetical protein